MDREQWQLSSGYRNSNYSERPSANGQRRQQSNCV